MNGKTAKLLRRMAKARRFSLSSVKQVWNKLPGNRRGEVARATRAALDNSKG